MEAHFYQLKASSYKVKIMSLVLILDLIVKSFVSQFKFVSNIYEILIS